MKQLPRLKQPLFTPAVSKDYMQASEDFLMVRAITAYDALWSLIYKPKDIALADRKTNAEAAMSNLGWQIEQTLGANVFDLPIECETFEEQLPLPLKES